jgi:hypothetical protein
VKVDHERAQVSGTEREINALLADPDTPLEPPLLADGVQAARAPLARFRLTGFHAELEACADARAASLVLPLRNGGTALRACTPSGLLGLLVRAVDLQPRPRHGPEPLTAAARVLAERSTADERLRAHLDALVAHWRLEAYGPEDAWYLEVLDTTLGLWTVEAARNTLTLTPTTATHVLDELAALPGRIGLATRA